MDFIPYSRELAFYEMQTVSSSIWIQVINSNSYNDKRKIKHTYKII